MPLLPVHRPPSVVHLPRSRLVRVRIPQSLIPLPLNPKQVLRHPDSKVSVPLLYHRKVNNYLPSLPLNHPLEINRVNLLLYSAPVILRLRRLFNSVPRILLVHRCLRWEPIQCNDHLLMQAQTMRVQRVEGSLNQEGESTVDSTAVQLVFNMEV